MRYIIWTIWATLAILLLAFLHYTLPQRDIVRLNGTEIRRVDFGENSIFWASPDTGTALSVNRDVRFINAVRPNGRVIQYRNEDTGWGWPPYFKLDSSNLQIEASDLVSSQGAPTWVALRHYGWRSEVLTIYPNAIGVRPVAGPDVRLIPWLNIVILTLLLILVLTLRAMWRQFRQRTLDPLVGDAGEGWDRVEERAAQQRAGWRTWRDGWRRRDRR